MTMPINDGIANKVTLPDGKTAWLDDGGIARTRLGWDALRDLGRQLCRITTRASGLIRRVFGENQVILLLLDVIDVLCPLVEGVADPLADGNDIPNETALMQNTLDSLQSIINKYGGA